MPIRIAAGPASQVASTGSSDAGASLIVPLITTWGWVLVALLGLLIFVAAAHVIVDRGQSFGAAIVAVAPWAPTIGSVSTIVAYLMLLDVVPRSGTDSPMWVNDLAAVIGAATGIVAWLLLATVYRPFTLARCANTGEYGELRLRLQAVRDRLQLWCVEVAPRAGEEIAADEPLPDRSPGRVPLAMLPGLLSTIVQRVSPFAATSALPADAQRPPTARSHSACPDCPVGGSAHGMACATRRAMIAAQEVAIVGRWVDRALDERECDGKECGGLPWVLGTGYVEQWQLIHAAEEALIDLESLDVVIRDALHDEARICGCEMENAADLLTRLRRAICSLSPHAAMYLRELPAQLPVPGGAVEATSNTKGAARSGACPDRACTSFRRELLGRSVLREVRHAINTYRDGRRAGLVRARAKLIKTIIMTGTATYGLLALAIMRGTGERVIVAGTAFYLVGAAVGLFNRLYQEAQADTAINDFGLSTARLIQAPMFSGLAAVGGVVITALLTLALQVPGTSQPHPSNLAAIFDLQNNQAGIVVAAIFGLTPNLLIQRLNTTADQYRSDLKNSQALKQRTGSG